jgi:trans-aconitate 2-methyltransferase
MWNPEQYARFGDERSRPFFELVNRIGATDPRTVVDLGCGPGALTASLVERWPSADVLGVDNDAAMLASATNVLGDSKALRFTSGDIATWRVTEPADVIVSNAALQWVPNHLELLPALAAQVKPGGWFAFQVPGNLDDAHHQAIRAVRRRQRWASIPTIAALPERTHVSSTAVTYTDKLADCGFSVDAWETTYVHILHGHDPILEWVKGTGLRPVLNALPSEEARDGFCRELAPLLRDAYPSRPYGTPFPFRRVFVVAHRPIPGRLQVQTP